MPRKMKMRGQGFLEEDAVWKALAQNLNKAKDTLRSGGAKLGHGKKRGAPKRKGGRKHCQCGGGMMDVYTQTVAPNLIWS